MLFAFLWNPSIQSTPVDRDTVPFPHELGWGCPHLSPAQRAGKSVFGIAASDTPRLVPALSQRGIVALACGDSHFLAPGPAVVRIFTHTPSLGGSHGMLVGIGVRFRFKVGDSSSPPPGLGGGGGRGWR